jgi:hypothetical protein
VQLRDLSTVLAAPGPFVTVLVGAESAVEQAADRYEMAWKSMLKQLEEQGVAAPVRDAISEARGEHADGDARLVVASVPQAKVVLSESVSGRPASDTVTLGTLPDLLPVVDELSTRVPHVVVLADRHGAEISAHYDMDRVVRDLTVKGTELHTRKVHGGGWSHRRYLHRVEEQWESTARDIATAVQTLAEQIDAEVIVGAGDVREISLVHDNLPEHLKAKWIEVEGTRGGDGSEDLVQQRIADAVSMHVAAETLELLGEYSQERGQDKRACDGIAAVVEALRKAQVQTLLVTTGADQEARLWFGEDATQLGMTRQDVETLGASTPTEGPLVGVLLRAALATGADVQLVPHQSEQAPDEGVGAILRYTDDSTPTS